jgi:phage tail-like protein
MATAKRNDPYRNYNFKVEVEGLTLGGFREVSGLDSAQDPIEYREGTDPLTVRKLWGLNKYSNVVLKWGIVDDAALWDWRKKCMDGKLDRSSSGSVILCDDTGEEKKRWNFVNPWPTKWSGPQLNATGHEVAVESLEIACEGVELAK